MRPLHPRRADRLRRGRGGTSCAATPPSAGAVRGTRLYAALRSPWLHALLERMRIEGCYGAYYPALPLAQHPPCLGHGRGQADRLSPVRQAGLGRILSAGQEAAQGLMCRTYRNGLQVRRNHCPLPILHLA